MKDDSVDCACLIHGTGYEWIYVEKLYSMLVRHLSRPVRFHVYTEAERSVPAPFIKHALQIWPGVGGPRQSWWYKMQLFNTEHHQGHLLYFDLDVVILQNLDWILDLDLQYFWAPKDFRYLFRGTWTMINSSCMFWDTRMFQSVWQEFSRQNIQQILRQYPGDQDYLSTVIDLKKRRYIDGERIKSWRWEIKDGGMDFKRRTYRRPDAGSVIAPNTHVMVFHGRPKPHELQDPIVQSNWC